MEELLLEGSTVVALLVEAAAVLVVMYGAAEAFGRLLFLLTKPPVRFTDRKSVWRRFGTWLLLGLEFELAADIVRSVISPTWQELVKLATIAVIRTFLNYFLEHDLETAGRPEESS
jgi:uncharacterized membrane protein